MFKTNITPQAKQNYSYREKSIVDHHLADNIYEVCTRYGNDIFLVADENTAELLNKNIFDKISHLIISAPLVISARGVRIYDRSNTAFAMALLGWTSLSEE